MKNYGVTGPPGIPNNVLDKFGMASAGNVEAIYIPFGCMYGIFTNIKFFFLPVGLQQLQMAL